MRLRRALRRLGVAAVCGVALAWVSERALELASPYPLARLAALERSTVVTAADGTWLQVWPTSAGERVLATRWSELPVHFRAAILVAEDADFFAHSGVDPAAVLRAAVQNVTSGRVVSGASTLTMQVVRIVEPRRRTLWAKLVEAVRARQLERAIGKQRILDLWATQVPMGGTLRGMEAASRYWFGRPAAALALHEAAALVAMVPAPSARAPDRHPALLRERRDALLWRMAEAGAISADAVRDASARPLGAARYPWPQQAWHLCAAELRERCGRGHTDLLATRADVALQWRLERVLAARTDAPGDGAAIVVLDRADGAVLALVGDRAGRAGQLDVSRCRRSVGSTLKPFLFALAVEQGAIAEDGCLDDVPLDLGGWRPANFAGGHVGRTRAADALATSANVPAVRCLQRTGVASFHALLGRLGLPVDGSGLQLDSALGTLAASPLELARAYRRFVAEPAAVGLSPRAVDWTLHAMARLPLGGDGAIAGRAAWKTGTSSGCRDAWCVVVTDSRIAVVWLGNRSGRGATDLVGIRSAAALAADLLPALTGEPPG
ncbi:MAG: transglycosylase domain-containing protein [Planctomycetes bacterium]|nr:transglycosylase domain-containing protein [Planctomycetota bacterium]